MQPPQSLKEIFKISNNNRKRNKQRKKSKLESCLSQSPFKSTMEQQEVT